MKMLTKKVALVMVSMSLMLPLGQSVFANDVNEMLLNSFSFQCPQVVTRDVGASLQNLNSLKVVVEELKNDADCGSSNQLNAVLQRYSSLYEDFEAQNIDKQSRLELEKRIAQYTQMLSDNEVSDEVKDKLSEELVLAQADLINVKARLKRFDMFSGKEARAANQLILAVDQYLANLDQNPKCVEKKGIKIANLVSNVLITTAAFANPGTALALAASGVIVQAGGAYVKNKKFDDATDGISDALAPTAIRCYSQALSEQYCAMNETLSVLEARKRDRENYTPAKKADLEGLNLLSYQLTGVTRWLEEVYSGSEITSEGDLVNREKPILQAELLKKIKMYAEAFASINTKSLNEIRNEKERSNAIAILIEKLAILMNSPSLNPSSSRSMFGGSGESTIANPIFATRTLDKLPFDIYRPGGFSSVPTCGVMNCSFSQYISTNNIILSLDNWAGALKNANEIIQGTLDRVNIERSKTISVDAYRIMVNANRDLKGEVNAIRGLKRISEVANNVARRLKDYGCREEKSNCETSLNPYYPQFSNVLKTKQLTDSIIELILESFEPRTIVTESLPKDCRGANFNLNILPEDTSEDLMEKKSFQIISCISKLLKLEERGVDVFLTKVKDIVAYDLEARLKKGELDGAVASVVDATRNDLVQTILNSYKTNESSLSIDEILIGIDSAKNNIVKSLDLFSDFLGKEIKNSIKENNLSTLEKKDFCMRLLPLLREENQSLLKSANELCHNVEMQAYKNGPKVKFSDYLKSSEEKKGLLKRQLKLSLTKNLDAQICEYRTYSKKNRLIDEDIRRKEILDSLSFKKNIKKNK